jgi:hypothetical protein
VKSARHKRLGEVLRALGMRDAALAQEAFEAYLKFYRKSEFPRDDWDEKVSLDGSILFHLARHVGVPLQIPEKYRDHIIGF